MSKLYEPKLPKWNQNLAYLFGLLIGDGSLPISNTIRPNGNYQKRHMIYFISSSLDFVKKIYIPIFKGLFNLTPYIALRKEKKNPLYEVRIESKILYNFLKNKGFTIGRKAKIAKVPNMPKKYEIYFLAGLLDTDGGKKGNGFGLSTASPYLAEFCIKWFKKLKFRHNSCPWHYKDHIYHQVYVPKSEMFKLLKAIPLKNKEKIFFIRSASVAQWQSISMVRRRL